MCECQWRTLSTPPRAKITSRPRTTLCTVHHHHHHSRIVVLCAQQTRNFKLARGSSKFIYRQHCLVLPTLPCPALPFLDLAQLCPTTAVTAATISTTVAAAIAYPLSSSLIFQRKEIKENENYLLYTLSTSLWCGCECRVPPLAPLVLPRLHFSDNI